MAALTGIASFISGLGFLSPALLLGLLALPALWWLLRMTPPPPKRLVFPAIRLLLGLPQDEETPARTPWWLLALRLMIATLIIVGLAHPVLDPGERLSNRSGSIILVVDNGWASAPGWSDRLAAMDALLVEAERRNRPARLITTAPVDEDSLPIVGELLAARALRPIVRALQPRPWQTDRAGTLEALEPLQSQDEDGTAEIFWVADGLEETSARLLSADFALALQKLGPVNVLQSPPGKLPHVLTVADTRKFNQQPGRPGFVAHRAQSSRPADIVLIARDDEGRILDRQNSRFEAGSEQAYLALDIPNDIRNKVARVEIAEEQTAAATYLLDERWRRRSVGLVSGQNVDSDQPLLSSHYYLQKALEPVADTRVGDISSLLKTAVSVVVLADVGRIVGGDRRDLKRWIDGGGVLVRFAGPRLAESGDDFVPVRLRTGNRVLAGAMTWSTPAPLMPFEKNSPFHGLEIPDDVLIRQQVLAEPSATLSDRTWARLKDGTPIVTAEKRGEGWLVLVHATANADWSDLPFSGLFIGMLERLINLAHGVTPVAEGREELKALEHLDAFGRLHAPQGISRTLGAKDHVAPGRAPGFYGIRSARRALNLGPSLGTPMAFGPLPQGISRTTLTQPPELDLKPLLLTAATLLLIVDFAISLLMRGLIRPAPGAGLRRQSRASPDLFLLGLVVAGSLALLVAGYPSTGQTQSMTTGTDDEFASAASLETRLAYIITGDQAVDRMSQAGLSALTEVVRARTSVEGGAPMGVDPEIDELVFFPLLYWPVTAAMPKLSEAALAKVDAFMKTGGTILFDTRDQQFAGIGDALGGSTAERARLQSLLRRLDVPPLVPVPAKHILTRAFYLLQDYPGRWAGGQVWVERHQGGINDGVSGLVIGGHDWAAAWATDAEGNPLAAVVPEGRRQREMAYRFGVNLVMYVLTGNYKADQVHIPALLERLGQ
jgi:hypothetical protein